MSSLFEIVGEGRQSAESQVGTVGAALGDVLLQQCNKTHLRTCWGHPVIGPHVVEVPGSTRPVGQLRCQCQEEGLGLLYGKGMSAGVLTARAPASGLVHACD